MSFEFKRAGFAVHAGKPRIEIVGRLYDGVETEYQTVVISRPDIARSAVEELTEAVKKFEEFEVTARTDRLFKLRTMYAEIGQEIAQLERQAAMDAEAGS